MDSVRVRFLKRDPRGVPVLVTDYTAPAASAEKVLKSLNDFDILAVRLGYRWEAIDGAENPRVSREGPSFPENTMTKQTCECGDRSCAAQVETTVEQLMELRENPKIVLISKQCTGPARPDPPVDEGSTFYVHLEE